MSHPPVTVPISRRTDAGDNVIVDPPELRRIYLANGMQFTRADTLARLDESRNAAAPADRDQVVQYYRRCLFPEGVADRVPGLFSYELDGRVHALYLNVTQNVQYVVECVEDRESFRRALQTEGAIVIYSGHARYGRGPCFGAPGYQPGDDWEDGAGAGGGIFRMGYPYVGIPSHELLDHGYRAHPVPDTAPVPARAECDPELRPHLAQLRPMRVAEMQADPAAVARLASQLGVAPDGEERFWTYLATHDREHGRECHVMLRAGWHDTPCAPADLGATDFACRMFCHFGCSTFHHNYRILRSEKGWTRDGDRRLAYWTTDLALGVTANVWLTHLLTYATRQDWRSWDPLVRYTVRRTNDDLRAYGYQWRVI